MKMSMSVALLALAAIAVLAPVTPAAADTVASDNLDMPIGKYISYYNTVSAQNKPSPAQAITPIQSTSSRKLLNQQASQAVQSSQAVQTAAAAATAKTVSKVDKADKDQHYGDYYGGAVSQPPPGAPVYYPPTYSRHEDHYDYIPGHYHDGRKLMAQGRQLISQGRMLQAFQEPDSNLAANQHAVAQTLMSKGNLLIKQGRRLLSAQGVDATTTASSQSAAQKVENAKSVESAVDKASQWGHYDYYGPSYAPHGDHYDYVPAHYHYHEGNHWHRKMMAAQTTESTQTANTQSAVTGTKSAKKAQHEGWGGSGHYDYYGPSYAPHGDHYDYVPAHYHYHEGEHGFENNEYMHHDDDRHGDDDHHNEHEEDWHKRL